MIFKTIFIGIGVLSVLSISKCSPIEPKSDSTPDSDKIAVTESVDITSDTETTITTVLTTDKPTVHSAKADSQHRFVRHQTDKPIDGPEIPKKRRKAYRYRRAGRFRSEQTRN